MGRNSNKPAPPVIPPGTVIPDPCLIVPTVSYPYLVHIPLEICRSFDINTDNHTASDTYWSEECELPELPVNFLIELHTTERIDFYPGQLHRLYQMRNESEVVKLIRNKHHHIGPGWFKSIPVNMTEKEYWENINQ